MARPSETLEWAVDETNIVAPDTAKKNSGWITSERPAAQFFNWFMNLAGKWVQNFVDELDVQVYIPIADLQNTNRVIDRRFEQMAISTLHLDFTNASWTVNDIAYTTNALGSTAVMVAVGDSPTIISRPQGGQWANRTPDNGFASGFLACAGGTVGFAAVGNGGEIQSSFDGLTWTERHLLGNNFTDVVYATDINKFLAVGLGGYIWSSFNLTTWTQQTGALGSSDLVAVAWGAGQFVVTSSDGKIQTSLNGNTGTWVQQASGTLTGTSPTYLQKQLQFNPFSLVHGFVALYNRNSGEIGVSSSPDGLTWTHSTSGSATNFDEPNVRLLILNEQIMYLTTTSTTQPYSLNAIVAQNANSRPSYSGTYRNIFDICELYPFNAIPVNGIIYVVGRLNSGEGCIYSGAPFYSFPA